MFSNLPPEIVDFVLEDNVLNSSDLAHAARVCRAWQVPATRHLFRHLKLWTMSPDARKSEGVVEGVADALQARVDLRPLVQSLEVGVCYGSRPSLHQSIGRIISCTSVKHLRLEVNHMGQLFAALPPNIEQLVSLELALFDSPSGLRNMFNSFPPLLPALRSVHIDCFMLDRPIPVYSDITPLAHQVSTLRLSNFGRFATSLLHFFTGQPAKLTALKIHFDPSDVAADPTFVIELEDFINLTIFELEIRWLYGHDPAALVYHANLQLEKLSTLTAARHVSVSFPFVGRGSRGKLDAEAVTSAFDDVAMWERLPPTVESFTITGRVRPESIPRIIGCRRLNLRVLKLRLGISSELEELALDKTSQARRDLDSLAKQQGIELKIYALH